MRSHDAAAATSLYYSGASRPTPLSIFGSIFGDLIEADRNVSTIGSAVTSLSSQAGTVLAPPGGAAAQRPTTGADGTNFKGRNVLKCALTGNKYLERITGPDLFSTGLWLYAATTFRSSTVSASVNFTPLTLWAVAATDLLRITNYNAAGIYGVGSNQVDASVFGTINGFDTNVHHVEVWLKNTGAGVVMLSLDGATPVQVASGLNGPTPRAVTSIGIGRNYSGSATGGNVYVGAIVICTNTPTDTQRAQGRAWMQTNWGAP